MNLKAWDYKWRKKKLIKKEELNARKQISRDLDD